MRKKLLYGIIIFQIILIISLVRGIQLSLSSNKRIEALKEEKAKLEAVQKGLKEEEVNVKSDFYLEQVARDELHLTKPGERIVIVPSSLILGSSARVNEGSARELPIWEKWWRVLRGIDSSSL